MIVQIKMSAFLLFLGVFVQAIGPERYEEGTELLFEVLQHPKLNKQVCLSQFSLSSFLDILTLSNVFPLNIL